MAEHLKKKHGKSGKQVTAEQPGSNLTQETFMDHRNKRQAAKAKMDEAKGKYANACKLSQDVGISEKELKLIEKIAKMDPDTQALFFKNLNQYLEWAGLETGYQFGLFESADLLERAFERGKLAFLEGSNTNDNPYQLNTDQGQKWLSGWNESQTAKVKDMAPEDGATVQ